jgi:hypothetical protein
MQNIVVLGLIPFTNIVLTFNEFLISLVILSITFYVVLRKTNNLQQLRLSIGLIVIIVRLDLIRVSQKLYTYLKLNWQNRLSPEL